MPRQGPYSQIGALDHVLLDGHPLMLIASAYNETEAQRFGDKISIGDIRYADFNPYESAEACGRFDGGFGLLRYSDLTDATLAHTYTEECDDVDTANGYAIMSGKRLTETITVPNAHPELWQYMDPIFMSEFTTAAGVRKFIAICGYAIFERDAFGTWTQLSTYGGGVGRMTCAGIFGSVLIIGFDWQTPAVWTENLTSFTQIVDNSANPLYVWAVTSDKGNAYIGAATGAVGGQIWSSTGGKIYSTTDRIQVAGVTDYITGLAPGGGAATVFFATKNGIGMIDTAGTVRMVVPSDWPRGIDNYEQSDYTGSPFSVVNGSGLGWWLGRGDNPQRGPAVLHFVRDGDPYTFAPGQTGQSGTAQNIAPWAHAQFQPPNQTGIPTAWFGTARYLYYAIRNPFTGDCFLVRQSQQSGATLHYWDLPGRSRAIAQTDLFGQPTLFVGCVGTPTTATIVNTPLPSSGSNPLADENCIFIDSGTMVLPRADMGFPDEPKIEYSVRVEADNLSSGVRYLTIDYALDGGSFVRLGTADQSPVTEILFDAPPSDHYMQVRANFHNLNEKQTMKVYGITLRRSINPTVYKWWEFDAWLPAGSGNYADDLQDAYQLRNSLWLARRNGTPVSYTDIHGDIYDVRIMNVAIKTVALEVGAPPQAVLHLTLLQAPPGGAPFTETLFSQLVAGTSWPLPIPLLGIGLGSSTLDQTLTITNNLSTTSYPRWTIRGPATYVRVSLGALTWTWIGTLAYADTLSLNFDPTKQTVLDSSGADRSSDVVAGSTYWGLAPGANSVSLHLEGGAAPTQVSITASLG